MHRPCRFAPKPLGDVVYRLPILFPHNQQNQVLRVRQPPHCLKSIIFGPKCGFSLAIATGNRQKWPKMREFSSSPTKPRHSTRMSGPIHFDKRGIYDSIITFCVFVLLLLRPGVGQDNHNDANHEHKGDE